MTDQFEIAVLVGSLRADGISHRAAIALARLAPPTLDLRIVSIGDLPLYSPDLEEGGASVEAWNGFRETIRGMDGAIFVTPEYNRSVPAALKNAIDVASRPYGKSAWAGKPAGVMSVSPGAIGAFGANHHLRQSLVFLDMPVLQQPEAYLGNASALFDAEGVVSNEGTEAFLGTFLTAFAGWVETFIGRE
jgi:chromate reductase